ncbi:foldase [Planococcus salinarum]|uniref:Foldase n=1 Tax=Planococcus salinarum TaxID=622695 RepID=A0ABX3D1S5_9BACL|nr:peptidylprolyl isomerase [Planococcus salinarum]OHX55985.1 foldase [Planococcus salinarum]TAA73072.1 foldase [Planococcus salinarum]
MKQAMYIAIGIIAASVVFLIVGFNKEEVVATVNGEEIEQDALYEKMVQTNGAEALDVLISNEIIRQEAEEADITVTEEELEAELVEYEEMYGGAQGLEAAIAESGLTMEDLKTEMEHFLKIEKMIGPDIEITDEAIETYFKENQESLGQGVKVEASHILTETKEQAGEVAKKLADGGDFAELATEYSLDAASAENGGELGSFGKGAMAPAFEEAAFAMEPGEISEPVETEFGYHIIKVTDKTEASEATLEDSREQIKEILFDEALNAQYAAWLAEKQAAYDIETKLNQG